LRKNLALFARVTKEYDEAAILNEIYNANVERVTE